MDLSRMDKIIKINVADGDVICQAGVGWEDLNAHLKEEGIPLFFPVSSSLSLSLFRAFPHRAGHVPRLRLEGS